MSSAPSSSRATLVNVLSDSSLPDQVLDVAAFLSRSKPEAERSDYINSWSSKATAAAEDSSKADAVVEELCGEFKGLGEGLDREIEGVHNLVSALIFSIADSSRSEQLIGAHVATISRSREVGRDSVKYRILSNIFNSLPSSSPLRETVFLALVDLASNNDDLDLISPALASLPHWLAQWTISEEKKAAVLETVAAKLEQSTDAEKAYEFRLAHLQYLSTNTSGSSDAATSQASAEKAVAAALKLPRVFAFDALLKLRAVDELQRSSPAVFSLVRILVQGSLADYQSWVGSNASELSRLGVDAAIVERKVRLLEVTALCSRALESAKSSGTDVAGVGAEVPYSSISQAIQIDESQVEAAVIDVIRAGLVNGKLSQVRSSFRVYRSTYRSFGAEQWKLLEERLGEWDRTLEGILATLSQPRGGQQQGQGQQGQQQAVAAA